MKLLLDDKSKINKFAQIFSYNNVQRLYRIRNGTTSREFVVNKMPKFFAFNKRFGFRDAKLKQLQDNFRNNLDSLWSFMQSNFYFNDKDHFRLDPSKDKLRQELRSLADGVWGSYGVLAEECKLYLNNLKQPINKLDVTSAKEPFMPIFSIQSGTKWEDIEFKFKNAYDLEVFIKDRFYKLVSNKEMGFFKKGTKDEVPDAQWDFLKHLSLYQTTDPKEATIETIGGALKITRSLVLKRKSDLSQKLYRAFGITEDPFEDYAEIKYYKPKFKIAPEPALRGDGDIYTYGRAFDANEDYDKDSGEPRADD